MSIPDVSELGLKCGLEIHQQLDTGKLFCRCPCRIREDRPEFEVVRQLRASAGETGEVDAAAAHEQAKAKRFRYQGYRDTCCLVELDEEPPHPLNPRALQAALQVAKLVDAVILDDIHVMRKTVVDGSNTSGFQRTCLVAIGGRLPEEPVRVLSLCLEEDSAKIVDRKGDEDVYNLSRLGVPLVEIATEPDITTPEQAQRVAAEIGMLLRSTGRCKRGLGTIRQDLNVSIRGGARVEIKGAQELKLIPEWVAKEAFRQRGLLDVKEELARRGITEMLLPPPRDVTAELQDGAAPFIAKGIANGASLVGIPLPCFAGLLGRELFPGYRLGTELAGYAKAFGFGGLIHSDEEMKKYGFSERGVTAARKRLGAKKGDSFLLLLGEKGRIEELFAFLLLPRIERLIHGVPNEVRKPNPDGTTVFSRPMPGAARMYPETDIPRVAVDASKVVAPKLLKEQEADLVASHRIAPAHAKELLREGWPFAAYVAAFPNLTPVFLATTILETPKELKKRYGKELDLAAHEEALMEILDHANRGAIPREAVIGLFGLLADGKRLDFSQYERAGADEVARIVDEVVAANPGASVNALMGEAMQRLRGKASGQQVMELLRKRAR